MMDAEELSHRLLRLRHGGEMPVREIWPGRAGARLLALDLDRYDDYAYLPAYQASVTCQNVWKTCSRFYLTWGHEGRVASQGWARWSHSVEIHSAQHTIQELLGLMMLKLARESSKLSAIPGTRQPRGCDQPWSRCVIFVSADILPSSPQWSEHSLPISFSSGPFTSDI